MRSLIRSNTTKPSPSLSAFTIPRSAAGWATTRATAALAVEQISCEVKNDNHTSNNTNDLKSANQALKASLNGKPVVISDAAHLHGLAAGLKHGEVQVQGDAGDYLGVLNAGATIHVTHNTGDYLADNMTAGTVIIEGSSGFGPASTAMAERLSFAAMRAILPPR